MIEDDSDLVARKIAAIRAETERKNLEAQSLLSYLEQQQEIAKEQEEKEEEDLKRQGIILGQHIPSLPSRLDLSSDKLSEFENFSSTLLVARDLVQQNRTNFLRRTGNLPISELAEAKKEASQKYLSQQDPDKPHYLNETKNAEVRAERVMVRFAETLQQSPKVKRSTLATTGGEETTKEIDKTLKKRERVISMKEKLEHESVLNSINHKLNYLRNPRNDPKAVLKMLTKTKEGFASNTIGDQADAHDNQTESQESGSSPSNAGKSIKSYKPVPVKDNPLFVCSPSTLHFQDYDLGKKYQQTITIRNVSAVSRTVRVLQPKLQEFKISPLKYPPNCPNGVIAPGMCVSCTLVFTPVALGDYQDFIQVDSESGSTGVKIIAQREPPQLSLPSAINLGFCLIGDAQRSSLVCTNTGGTGNFELLESEDAPSLEGRCLRVAPFTIYPTQFELNKGESVELVFEFVPTLLGKSNRTFFIRCDNGQVREFTLQATSKEISLAFTEINNVLFETKEDVFSDLVFKAIPIGSESSQQIVVINDSGLPVEYEWIWVDTKFRKNQLHNEGQRQILQRQEEQRPITEISSKPPSSPLGSNSPGDVNGEMSLVGDASLLRSIRESLEGGSEKSSLNTYNSARNGDFEIQPARGILAGEGAGEFKIIYAPNHERSSALRAVMMIKTIPIAALPCAEQGPALDKLRNQGHGSFMRLRSWIEELSTEASVPQYKKGNGAIAYTKGLVSLTTIVGLLSEHVARSDDASSEIETEFSRFSVWVRKVLKHVYDIRNDDLILLEEESKDQTLVPKGQTIELFDWMPDSDAAPMPVLPLVLNNDVLNAEDEEADEYEVRLGSMEFSEANQMLMKEVWVDSKNTLVLLGAKFCDILNDQVQHEAVEYLKDNSLNNFASVSFLAHGAVNSRKVTVSPPCLEIGGLLPLGKAWEGSVTLHNSSSSPLELRLDVSNMSAKRIFSSSVDEVEEDMDCASVHLSDSAANKFSFIPDCERVLLMPNSSHECKFKLEVQALGRYELLVPLEADDNAIIMESIFIQVTTAGPQLRFDIAEIDFGLLGVGGDTIQNLSFTNESEVPAMFMMKPTLHFDMKKGNVSLSGGATGNNRGEGTPHGAAQATPNSRPNSQRDPPVMLSARSDRSRQSSGEFSIAESNASSNDAKIESKNAVVTIEPSSRLVMPKSSQTVQIICKAGKVPQRIRGMIETRVFDASGSVEVHRQYVNMRGEVQTPKVLLYPLNQSLGQVYVGRPVSFSFTLENICNLPTKFKFLRPGGQSAFFSFNLNPMKGSLEAKEKLLVQGTFTALAPGLIDDVLSCKLFGVSLPLGFAVKAFSKGINLDFLPLQGSEPVPAPLAAPDLVQLPNNEKPPEPGPIEPLIVGEDVPLYERRKVRFVVRNLSAIPAAFDIKPKKFAVVERRKRFSSTASQSSTSVTTLSSIVRNDLILAPHEDGVNKFQSEAGQKYIGAEVNRREDRRFLGSGLGASYFLECTNGTIPPWGVQEVIVHVFNDIPGCYNDDIEFYLQEGDIVRKFSIPIKLTVLGCPVVIEKSTLGMTEMSKKGPPELVGKQMLQLGEATEFSNPLKREFYVRNFGSKPGKISWLVRGLAGKAYGPVKVAVKVSSSGEIKSQLRFWEDIAKESPFVIEPKGSEILPYGRQKFTITLTRNTPACVERALLNAVITMGEESAEDDDAAPTNTDDPSSNTEARPITSKPKRKFELQLLLEGTYLHPRLVVDKNTFTAPHSDTQIEDIFALRLKAKATLLFAKGGKPSDVCYRLVEITNPLESDVVINTSLDGPFILQEVPEKGKGKPSVTILPPTGSTLPSHPSSTTTLAMSTGKVIHLIPHQSSKFIVAFNPKKQIRDQLIENFGKEVGKPTEQRGSLVFTYPTGQSMRVPIITEISTPYICGSSPRLYFGICHVRQNCQGVFLLSNPTDVPARWTVTHLPGGGLWKRSTAIRVKGFETVPEEDDPDVFSITPNAGVVEGPTLSVTAAMAAPPKDYNRNPDSIVSERTVESSWASSTLTIKDSLDNKFSSKHQAQTDACYPMPLTIVFTPKANVRYCSRFRFSCEFANSFELVLQGEGTFEEHEHRPLNPLPR